MKGVLLGFVMICYCAAGLAQQFALDASFGNGGVATASFGNRNVYSSCMALQADGKIVVAGSGDSMCPIARFLPNGNIDSSFGTNGLCSDIKSGWASDVVVQPDGKIIFGGANQNFQQYRQTFQLGRLKQNGTLDSSFGVNGINILIPPGIGQMALISKMSLTADGKILIGGFKRDSTVSKYLFCAARFKSNGTLDSSYGVNGFAKCYQQGKGLGMAVHNQEIYLGGIAGPYPPGQPKDFGFLKILATGFIDSSFGNNGYITTDFADSSDYCTTVTLQSDGKIIASGYVTSGGEHGFGMVRYKTNGSIDSSFGVNGKVIDTSSLFFSNVHVLPSGKILLNANPRTSGAFKIIMYNANGTRDSSFGINGSITTYLPGPDGYCMDSRMQSDGKLTVAGYTTMNAKIGLVVARYGAISLPVHLLTFTARLQDNKALLTWTVEAEQNFDRYQIERSSNGKDFTAMGSVKANNSKAYSYIDAAELSTGVRYYRLKLIDRDGKFEYSPIRSLNINHSTFTITPNPAHDRINLSGSRMQSVTIVDMSGKVVKQQTLGSTDVATVNISGLAKGVYTIKVKTDTGMQAEQLVVE